MIQLRQYQKDTITALYAEMRAGRTRVVVVMPTGSGKTCTGASVVEQGVRHGRSVMWIVHRTELVDQAAGTLHDLGLEVGVISATSQWPVRPDARVQVASVQTLAAREGIRPPAHLLVWDECHHAGEAAAEWIKVLDAYPGVPILGLTATPERGDGTGLAPIFTGIVQTITARQLLEMGHLVRCEVERPSRWLKEKRQSGNPLAMDPVDAWRQHCGDRQGFMFCATVDEAEEYASKLPSAIAISAGTPAEIRADALSRFRAGSLKTLCNVYVFTEGTDLPMASACVLARGASTAGGFLQMVGRVLRPHPGKRDALLVDLQGISHVWGMPEDERLWRLTGKACVQLGRKCEVCKTPIEDYPCPNCGYAPEPENREQGVTEILNERLERFARKMAAGPEQRAETVRRWMAECAHKDRAPGSVRYRFQNAYQIEITANEYFRALADLTHDASPTVSQWATKHLHRISEARKVRKAQS